MGSRRPRGAWFDCVKYLLFTFNLLFWLFGCTVVALGVWIVVDPTSLLHQTTNRAFHQFVDQSESTFSYQFTGAYILIAVGAAITVVGFVGCCATLRLQVCLLGTFFVLLLLIFVVLITAGIYAILLNDSMEDYIRDPLTVAVRNYANDTQSKLLLDFIQSNFRCCGATSEGASDYGAGRSPDSCANYIAPCPPSIYYEMAPNLIIIAGVAVGFAVILMMGMIFSLSLCCCIMHQSQTLSR